MLNYTPTARAGAPGTCDVRLSPVAPMPATREAEVARTAGYGVREWTGWVLGPAVLLLTLIVPPPE